MTDDKAEKRSKERHEEDKKLTTEEREFARKAAARIVENYGETLKLLGRE